MSHEKYHSHKSAKLKEKRTIAKQVTMAVAMLTFLGMAASTLVDLYGVPIFGVQGQLSEKKLDTIQRLDDVSDLLSSRVSGWFKQRRGDIYLTGSSLNFTTNAKAAIDALGPLLNDPNLSLSHRPEKTLSVQKSHARYYNRIIKAYDIYDAIYLVDPKTNRVIISSREEDFGKQLVDPELIEEVILSQTPIVWYSRGAEKGSGGKILVASSTLRVEDQTYAILIFEVKRLAFVGDLSEDLLSLGNTGEVFFVDDEGLPITPLRYEVEADKYSEFQNKIMGYLEGGVEAITELVDYRGEDTFTSVRYIWLNQRQGISLIIKLDAKAVNEELDEQINLSFITSIILIILSVVVMAYVIRRLTKPIHNLTKTAELITAGNMDVRAAPGDTDEINRLALSLNTMLDRMEEHNLDLKEARNRAEEATKAKDMFLAAMSHEIRTPMNGVIGMIELLQTTSMREDQKQMLTTVKDSAFTLLTIINDILDFSKIEAGKMDIEEIDFDIRKSVDSVGDMLGVFADKKKVPLIVDVAPDVPCMLLGDQVRVRQILFNLAGNAVKFTETGMVKIHVKLAKKISSGFADVAYEITDTGIGMTEEQISRLFTPFEQAESATTRKYGGTGLGLSIVSQLCDLMLGNIDVKSTLGQGSTFTVTLRHKLPVEQPERIKDDMFDDLNCLGLIQDQEHYALLQALVESGSSSAYTTNLTTTIADILAILEKAETEGNPFNIIYLGSHFTGHDQDQVRASVRSISSLKEKPRFLIERMGEMPRQDLPDSVFVPLTPFSTTNLLRSFAIVLGRLSPEITSEAVDGSPQVLPTIDEAEANGQLILVAEDNKTNQDVIGRQLTVFGYAHEMADDGEIARDMMNKRRYGLLLTDVHMPNMDGYELTAAIRIEEEKNGGRIPIIAVTANALQGEGDRCLAAGMDGYLSKPVSMKQFRQTLGQWLPQDTEDKSGDDIQDKVIVETSDEPVVEKTEDTSVVNLQVLIDMFGDDDDLIDEIIASYTEPAWECATEIFDAFDAKDMLGVGAGGHKLKSSARSIGANIVADLCEELELSGKGQDEEAVTKLISTLKPAMEQVDLFIKKRLA